LAFEHVAPREWSCAPLLLTDLFISISDHAVELPDGTMVIPIDDEEEEEEVVNVKTGSRIEKVSANNEEEIAVANFEEDEDSFENEPESTRSHNTQGSVCSLSTKFGQNRPKNVDTLATVTSSTYGPTSEDRSSIISLSDKYRQQVKIYSVFHRFRQAKLA
jgi:hypothetical protein